MGILPSKPRRGQRDPLYAQIRDILESARSNVARSVNTTHVITNWLIGREIVEEEQRGKVRAEYGAGLMRDLSSRLTADYGNGFSLSWTHYRTLLRAEKPEARARQEIRLPLFGEIAVTLSELEIRVANLEQQLAHLAAKVDARGSANLNAWIDQIHGTFQNDAAYRQAAHLGREWRKSHRRPATCRSRKIAGK